MKTDKINFVLHLVAILLLAYIAFGAPYKEKVKIKRCFDVAVNLEKARHYPVDDLEVTNQDISSFQKNMAACLAD
ncbi:MAG TPA: hypothetical protein VF438_04005 [Candidatus Paceibacterota bacterium]